MNHARYTGTGTDFYVAAPATAEIVNLAIDLGRPILVEGEPGCGKTQLAASIASELELDLEKIVVKSTSRAQDLLYRMNGLGRLQDAQRQDEKARFVWPYLSLGLLGRVIHARRRCVVLIDEIDKADIDFPNDLLDVLEKYSFQVDDLPEDEVAASLAREQGFGRTVTGDVDAPPIVVITSNREKRLPEPFLRRCLYVRVTFPEDANELREIVRRNARQSLADLREDVLNAAVVAFLRVRKLAWGRTQKPPTTSELIDWVRIVHWKGVSAEALAGADALPPYWQTLFKTMGDLDAYEALAQARDGKGQGGVNAEAPAGAFDENALPLEGLYLHLVRAGFPISVREYEDLLRALRRGHGVGSRERLRWLARTLWARSDEETVRLDAVLDRLAPPADALVRELTGAGSGPDAPLPPAPTTPAGPAPDPAAGGAVAPMVEFAAGGATGTALPSVRHQRLPARRYVFELRPPVAPRHLALAWRRFRVAQRAGAKTELDLDATVAEQCRRGWLLGPVLVAPRRNRARLLVLMDASASMVAWRGLAGALAESLPQGRLAHAGLLFFDNDPGAGLYRSEHLAEAVSLDAALAGLDGGALLVVGDGGAARGRLDRDRVAATREFIAAMRERCAAMAWLNPLPRLRWAGSSAARTARDPWCTMEPFDADGLVRAVDHLRGARV